MRSKLQLLEEFLGLCSEKTYLRGQSVFVEGGAP